MECIILEYQNVSITLNLKYGNEVGLALTITSVKLFNHNKMGSKIHNGCLKWKNVKEITNIIFFVFSICFFKFLFFKRMKPKLMVCFRTLRSRVV